MSLSYRVVSSLAASLLAAALLSPALAQTGPAKGAEAVKIDFSCVGYRAGAPLPAVRATVRVTPSGGDDTQRLQDVIDRFALAGLTRSDGTCIEIDGTLRVSGTIRLHGVGDLVLRGATPAATIVGTGDSRRTLIEVGGTPPKLAGASPRVSEPVAVSEDAPAGARELSVVSVESFRPGRHVVICRPSTEAWIEAIGMDKVEGPGAFADMRVVWKPGSRDLVWDRTVTAVDAERKRITLDAPITAALEARYGGGTVTPAPGGPSSRLGIERLRLVSEFDGTRPHDEEHAWIGVALDNVEDAWVRDVTFEHFAGSAVRVGNRARRVTVENCQSLAPISEPGGYRRQSFLVEGQQVLVRGCTAEHGMNDFAVGQLTAGPVAFVDCVATKALGDSGAFESWASGVLYQNVRVEGAGIRLAKDYTRGQGGGWTAANCVVWNCEAAPVVAEGPAGAENLVISADHPMITPAKPAELPEMAREDALLRNGARRGPAPETPSIHPVQIVNGRFVVDGRTLWGGYQDEGWWRGQTYPATAEKMSGRSVTRFVPGRVGPGLTEDLAQLARDNAAAHTTLYFGGVGLWYDRRRDTHLFDAMDAHVWAPFYEMPWARTGTGRAWDGLSKFDLSKFNPWFFDRSREFADRCDEQGIVYEHYLYNTHNILETKAHYVDYPWRPANNVNETGIPEPPPLDARNTVHLNDHVYNVDHPGRRALHRAYIRHTLDELAGAQNVVFTLAAQFAGPLAFQQFFLDTVAEWEQQHGRRVRVGLVTSKEITDAILSDPVRGKQIGLVDMRYWQYRPDGKDWMPRGDRNRAFREQTTEQFGSLSDTPPPTTPLLAYKQVREYRDRYPDLGLVVWHNGVDAVPALMGGASQVIMKYRVFKGTGSDIADTRAFDAFVRDALSPVLMAMRPRDGWVKDGDRNWCLADDAGRNVLLYSTEGDAIVLSHDVPGTGATWVNPKTGERRPATIVGKQGESVAKPDGGAWLLWTQAAQ